MKHLTLRIAVAFVTFAIGTTASYLCHILLKQLEEIIPMREVLQAESIAEKKRTYELKVQALGMSGNYRSCFSTFESSDGMVFTSATINCRSPKGASRELERKLRRAVEIIKREAIYDDAGRQVGKRVVATFVPYKGASTVSAEILWTRGSDFGYIQGSSLRNIQEYENDHKH